jgi:hypothetical protein
MVKSLCVLLTVVVLSYSVAFAEPTGTPQGGLAPSLSGHPPLPVAPAPDAKVVVTGKVLETMTAGGYTYVRVKTGDDEMWAAGPQTEVGVGDTVSFPRGMGMKDFRSEKLNRTFDSIAFVNSITVGAAASGSASIAPTKPDPHGAVASSATGTVDLSGIERPEGGKTVGEVFDKKDALAGQEIVIRAKVVKVNRGIMGRNWLHLRDGTKSSSGADDLTVTSSEAADVGQKVLVRGKVAVNRDFGFGYHYDVVVEDAKITVE